MVQDGHNGLGQLRIVVVGENVDEVSDARPPAARRKLRPLKAGKRRLRDTPRIFSSNQRRARLASAALARPAKVLAKAANSSVRDSAQSVRSRPCSMVLAALASSINLGMFT
jgi:hypothetical protein